MKKLETIRKDIQKVRLTITRDRVTMKFPLDIPDEKVFLLQDFFLKISDEFPSPQYSLRGEFNPETHSIALTESHGSKSHGYEQTPVKTFYLDKI